MENWLNRFYLKRLQPQTTLQSLAPKANQIEEQTTFYHHSEDESTANLANEDEPVIQLLNSIFETALQKMLRYSFRNSAKWALNCLRIDGVLQPQPIISKSARQSCNFSP